MYYLYLLQCKDNTIYTGITTDLARRLKEHQAGKGKGARYTKIHGAEKIIYSEKVGTVQKALLRERTIKSWPRPKKLELARKPAKDKARPKKK